MRAFGHLAAYPYNYAVSSSSSSRARPSLWARFAAFLSFLAVLLALVAPASMLAEELRTGKLGGICAANTASWGGADASDAGNGSTPQAGSHCELCGSLGLALPPLPVASMPCDPGTQVVGASSPIHRAESISGLPFSRGPPVL